MCVIIGCTLYLIAGGSWKAIPTIAGVGTIITAFFMGPLIEFFNVNKPFRPLRSITMARLNNHLGIDYEIMEEYNEIVSKEKER